MPAGRLQCRRLRIEASVVDDLLPRRSAIICGLPLADNWADGIRRRILSQRSWCAGKETTRGEVCRQYASASTPSGWCLSLGDTPASLITISRAIINIILNAFSICKSIVCLLAICFRAYALACFGNARHSGIIPHIEQASERAS